MSATFELEHAIGYSGAVLGALHLHPNGVNFISAAGGCLGLFNYVERNFILILFDLLVDNYHVYDSDWRFK